MDLNIGGRIQIKTKQLSHDVAQAFSFYKYRTDKRALGISVMDSWLMITESLQMSPNSHCSAVVTYKFTLTA